MTTEPKLRGLWGKVRPVGVLPLVLTAIVALVLLAWGFSPAGGKVETAEGTIVRIGNGATPQSGARHQTIVVEAAMTDGRRIKVAADSRTIAHCRVGGPVKAVAVKLNMGVVRWETATSPCG